MALILLCFACLLLSPICVNLLQLIHELSHSLVASFSIPNMAEGACDRMYYHEWACAFQQNHHTAAVWCLLALSNLLYSFTFLEISLAALIQMNIWIAYRYHAHILS